MSADASVEPSSTTTIRVRRRGLVERRAHRLLDERLPVARRHHHRDRLGRAGAQRRCRRCSRTDRNMSSNAGPSRSLMLSPWILRTRSDSSSTAMPNPAARACTRRLKSVPVGHVGAVLQTVEHHASEETRRGRDAVEVSVALVGDQPVGLGHAGLEVRVLAAQHDVDLGVRVEVRDLDRRLVRLPPVVGVAEADELAGGGSEAGVAAGPQALVGPAQHAHAGVALGQGRRAVGRAVVDHHDLDRRMVLGHEAVEALGQELLAVLDRHDDGDERVAHPATARPRCAASPLRSRRAPGRGG